MRILVVEDEQKTADYLQQGLTESGYVVDCAASGIDGLHLARQNTYELVILDVNLPNTDGWEVLEQLRRDGNQRVMMLTARGRLADKIKGLDMGADDYLVKPFDLAELKARLRALLRRSAGRARVMIEHAGICLDPSTQQVSYHGEPVLLTPKEYQLLHELLSPPGRVMTRDQLMQLLYGWNEEAESNTLEVHIHHLRKKFSSELIRTVRGVGYLVEERG